MSLPRDGIEFVAQGASKFIGTLGAITAASDRVGDVLSTVTSPARAVGDALGKLGGGIADVTKDLLKFAAVGAAAATASIIGIGVAIGKLATEASKLQGIALGFGNFAAQTEAGAEAVLSSLQAASAGMIPMQELMSKFNTAASLVNVQFAERLPEALEIIGKVSAATGTDINFLFDSYIKGVGRVQPLILDNLFIQVSVAEATVKATEMFGKQEDQLTKLEKQTAINELTLIKLTEKFGDLPDVTQSATANIARVQAQLTDAGAQIGAAFLPAWTTMTSAVADAVTGFSRAISQGGVLFPILANLGAAASILADKFSSAVTQVVGFVDMLGFSMTNVAEVTTSSLIQMQEQGGSVLDNIGQNFDERMQDTINSALDWGTNIATSFAQGLIDGAATAITVAMNFISGMLSGWLAPGSPPRVAPDLPEWGAGAMTEFLEGFTQADFGVLEGIQAPLSKVMGDIEFAEVSQEIARAISAGEVDEGLFDTIAASAGEFGTEIADLARLQFELVGATDALTAAEMAQATATNDVADAQDRLDETMKAIDDSQAQVTAETQEYNRLLREGATQEQLDAQLNLINAAEMQRDAAIEQNRTATAGLETAEMVKDARDDEADAAQVAAQAEVDAAEERLKNQEDLVNQLISLSEKAMLAVVEEPDEATKKALKGKEGVVTPEVLAPDIGIAEAFDFTGGLTAAIENAKGLLLEKFGGIFDPIRAIIDEKFGPESAIGQKWGEIADQIKAVWDTKLVPFWEDTLKPAIGTVQDAFGNMQTFWETSTIPELAGKAFGIFLSTVTDLAAKIIPFFAAQLLKLSQWYIDNGPMIDTVVGAIVVAWEMVAPAFVLAWNTIEPLLGFMVDSILNLGTAALQLATGDWAGAWETIKEIAEGDTVAMAESQEAFVTGLGEIASGPAWQAFADTWSANWDQAKLIVSTVWTNIKTSVSTTFTDILTGVNNWFTELIDAWSTNWDNVLLIVSTTWENIKTSINTFISDIFTAMGLDLDVMKERWSVIWDDVLLIVSTIWTNIETAINKKITEIANVLFTKWTEIATSITDKMTEIFDSIFTKWAEIKTSIETAGTEIATSLNTIWTEIVTSVTGKVQEIFDIVTEKIGEITTWITEQAETFKAWGRDMVDGLVKGITGKIASVITTVTSAVESAIAAAKKALGISSPSTVFTAFGENAGESFAGGLLSTEQMMTNAMGSMFGAGALQPIIQPSFAGAQFAQEAQPMMREVSIQIGPNFIQGMNDREFVQRVRQVLRNELRRN